SRNSRTSVSNGVSPRVARSAGTVSLRASAAYAGAPSRSSRPSAVKEAPRRASRSRAAASGRSDEGRGGRPALLTPPLWPPPPSCHRRPAPARHDGARGAGQLPLAGAVAVLQLAWRDMASPTSPSSSVLRASLPLLLS